jgi:uncharacterized LabA/DUF88 family protein
MPLVKEIDDYKLKKKRPQEIKVIQNGKPARLPIAPGTGGRLRTVLVYRTEEKGSDVNLATHLLKDGFAKKYDIAIIISNDSDLLEPVRVVVQDLNLKVVMVNPTPTKSTPLNKIVPIIKIRPRALVLSQFPNSLTDDVGTFTKPPPW